MKNHISWVNTIIKINTFYLELLHFITLFYHIKRILTLSEHIVKLVKRNFVLTQKFLYKNLKNSTQLSLILDVSIRWNYQYDMFYRFEKLKLTINYTITKKESMLSKLILKNFQWKQATYFIQLLKFIKKITNYLL